MSELGFMAAAPQASAGVPGTGGRGGHSAAHPFLDVLDSLVASGEGAQDRGAHAATDVLGRAVAAQGAGGEFDAGDVVAMPTDRGGPAPRTGHAERGETAGGQFEPATLPRFLSLELSEPPVLPPHEDPEAAIAGFGMGAGGASAPHAAGQEADETERSVLTELANPPVVAAADQAGERPAWRQEADPPWRSAARRVPERPEALRGWATTYRAKEADGQVGREEPAGDRGNTASPRSAGAERLSGLRDNLLAQAMDGGRPAPRPAAPETVSTTMSAIQELGEDLSGRSRMAMPSPNPAPSAGAYGADPAGSGASPMRAAIPALALEVASQARHGNRHFEIRLDPPELGRIEVRLDFSRDGQMTTKMLVERPETLDMLMRDARGLEKALQANGLKIEDGTVQYELRDHSAFGQHERPAGHGGEERLAEDGSRDDQGEGQPVSRLQSEDPWRRVSAGGVDLRV